MKPLKAAGRRARRNARSAPAHASALAPAPRTARERLNAQHHERARPRPLAKDRKALARLALARAGGGLRKVGRGIGGGLRTVGRQVGGKVGGGLRKARDAVLLQEDLNFLLTNRVPRHALTHLMGWYSRLENPLLAKASIAVWKLISDLDLDEAEPQRYRSLQQCFTRALKPGMRTVDPDPAVLASPSDGIVGACGDIAGTRLFQAKGLDYTLAELLGDAAQAERYRDGCYATLRLTSAMYHRFHAPVDGRLTQVNYISGDTWNVNPIALKRVEKLFCRNERAVLQLQTPGDEVPLLLVPVAAILVASIRLHALDVRLHLKWQGPNHIPCDVPVRRGEELGWFEHGSTIIVVAPKGHRLAEGIAPGTLVRMGQRLLQRPD